MVASAMSRPNANAVKSLLHDAMEKIDCGFVVPHAVSRNNRRDRNTHAGFDIVSSVIPLPQADDLLVPAPSFSIF